MPEYLPTLHELGASDKFTRWWPNQERAILQAVDSPKRFVALCLPVGFGKSPIAIGRAVMSGARTIYLTSTKGLQDQVYGDFNALGLADVRGQENYQCLQHQQFGIANAIPVSAAPCHAGVTCPIKESTCTYYKAVREARQSTLTESNYPYWMLQNLYGDGLGKFDLMVCDEVHQLTEEVCNILSTTIHKHEVEAILGSAFPHIHASMNHWRGWAGALSKKLDYQIADMKEAICIYINEGEFDVAHQMGKRLWERKDLKRRLDTLAGAKGDWVAEMHGESMTWDAVWPQEYTENMLFWHIPKILLMSATMTPKTLELAGVAEDQYEFIEYPSPFPVEVRPFYCVANSTRMNKNTDEEGYRNWLTQIDQFISKGRIDRKGIIHTVSYKRAQMVMEKSEFRKYMLSHNSRNTRAMVEAFRKSSAPCIMVSPCLDTGYDFPNSQARWQIIGKLPWPDTRSIVMQARKKMDEDYMAHLTMQTLQQTYGRIVRGPGDWGETICLDASIAWFMRIYGHFANSWFKEAIQWRNTIPEPLNL